MPFDNISPDQETDYFSDGLTEELMARLSLVSEIELISRWASKQMRERKSDVRAIKEELGARYIVGGSVRRFQDSVRITVQLVDTVSNRPAMGQHLQGQARRHLRHPGAGRAADRRGTETQAYFRREGLTDQAPDGQRAGLRSVPARPGLSVSAHQAQHRVLHPAVREGDRTRPALCGRLCGLLERLRADVSVLCPR